MKLRELFWAPVAVRGKDFSRGWPRTRLCFGDGRSGRLLFFEPGVENPGSSVFSGSGVPLRSQQSPVAPLPSWRLEYRDDATASDGGRSCRQKLRAARSSCCGEGEMSAGRDH